MRTKQNKEKSNLKNEFKSIFVDLDGTLIRTDLFVESILMFLKQNPLNIFLFLRWIFSGRSVAKTLVAKKVKIDVKSLPYEIELIEYLREKKNMGIELYFPLRHIGPTLTRLPITWVYLTKF